MVKRVGGKVFSNLDKRLLNSIILLMVLDRRTEQILNAAIESFIEKGEPVSSQWLYDHYKFGIKPAMIRHELESLTEEGFLSQPYHSAGRIPSDKGFGFFARFVLESECEENCVTEEDLHSLLIQKDWDKLLRNLASELGVLTVVDNGDEIIKEGLDCLVQSYVWQNPEDVHNLIRDFVNLDERIEHAGSSLEFLEPIRIFIGRSPFTKSDGLSVIMAKYDMGKSDALLCVIGPKRMNYRRVVHIMRGLNDG